MVMIVDAYPNPKDIRIGAERYACSISRHPSNTGGQRGEGRSDEVRNLPSVRYINACLHIVTTAPIQRSSGCATASPPLPQYPQPT
jgi:hypothetical protein